MCKSSVLVGNAYVSAGRTGSNPCRGIHLFFSAPPKKNSAFSQQCNHIVEIISIGIQAVVEYWLTLHTHCPKMRGSNPVPRNTPFFFPIDSGLSKGTFSFFPAVYDLVFITIVSFTENE